MRVVVQRKRRVPRPGAVPAPAGWGAPRESHLTMFSSRTPVPLPGRHRYDLSASSKTGERLGVRGSADSGSEIPEIV